MFLSPRRAGDRTTATSLTASIPFLSSSRSFFQPVKRTAVKTCFPLSSSFIFFVTLARTYLRLNQVTRSRRLPVIATPHGRGGRGKRSRRFFSREKLTRNDPTNHSLFSSLSVPLLSAPRAPCFYHGSLPSFLYLSRWCVSLVTGNVATNELKRNFEEGRKRCHFHPRYSTISSDMEDLRDGSRNRLWSGNVTPLPPSSLTPCIFPPPCTFPFYGQKGQGEGDKTIRLSQENMDPFLCSPMLLPLLNFRPTFLHDFSRNICFSRYRTGKRNGFLFSISAIRRRIN